MDTPEYKTQCISLNAQDAKVPRGTIIAVKGSVPVSASFTGTAATIAPTATFTGTQAALSGDAEDYTPAGTISVTGASYTPAGAVSLTGGAASDGTYDVLGAGDGAYGEPYGLIFMLNPGGRIVNLNQESWPNTSTVPSIHGVWKNGRPNSE